MSELKKLTRLGSDTKKIAALLQAKAPKGHMLAYINPREAALLKQHGGSGKPHADTGILSFEDGMDAEPGFETYQPPSIPVGEETPIQGYAQKYPDLYPGGTTPDTTTVFYPDQPARFSFAGAPQVSQALQARQAALPSPVASATGAALPETAYTRGQDIQDALAGATGADLRQPVTVPTPKETGLFGGMKDETMARLGLAGGLGLLGQRQAARAGQIGQKGAQQIQQLAAPYQQKGQQIQAQAQRGELTPAGQQSLQALQARAAQAAESRGGVGAQQAQQQIEAFRQQLLQQQYDYGLKLSGIGDNIALGAIKTGLQADQYVNQLTNSFYTNMAYIASGMAPGAQAGGR